MKRMFIFILMILISLVSVNAFVISDPETVAYYDLSSFTDNTGNFGTLTTSGDPTNTTGIIGSAVDFDGNDNAEDSLIWVTGYPFTFNAWVKQTIDTVAGGVVAIGNSATNNQYQILQINNGFPEAVSRDSSIGTATATTDIGTGTWYMVTAVFNSASDRRIYVNGINEVNDTTSITFSGAMHQSVLGQNADNQADQFFDGVIDEVSIWNKTLTTSEILTLYNGGVGCTWNYATCSSTTPAIVDNVTSFYNSENISISLNTTTNTNMSYVLDAGSEISICTNCNSSSLNLFNLSETLHNITFISTDSLGQVNTSTSFTIDTTNPTINNSIPTEINSYSFLGSYFSCSDTNLDSCNISIDGFDKASGTNFTLTHNGNLSYNITTIDLAGNTLIENGTLFVNPIQTFYFTYTNGTFITNFDFGGETWVNFANITTYNSLISLGSNNLTFEKLGFATTNVIFNINTTSELNLTTNITESKIVVTIYDRITGNVLTNLTEIILVATQGFSGNTTTGFLNITDINFLSETYQLVAEHVGHATEQVFFTYTNQELLTIDVYMLDINDTNFGVLTVKTVTSDSELIPDAVCQLLEWFPSSSAFVTVAQGKTNTQGEFTFNIELDVKVYKVLCTKGDVTATSLPTEGGIISVSEQVFPIIMDDPSIFLESRLKNFAYTFINTTENVTHQRLTFTWIDTDGLVSEACINVYNNTASAKVLSSQTCASGASGQIQILVNINNTFDVLAQATVETSDGVIENLKQIIFKGTQTLETLLAKYNIDMILPLIIILLGISLGLSLEPQNIYISELFVLIGVWVSFALVPTVISLGITVSVSVIVISLLFMGATR